MKTRLIAVAAVCGMLAACGSSSEPAPAPSETAAAVPAATTSPAPAAVTPAEARKAAPEGLPSRIARETITAGGHACASVSEATRDAANGTITATCSSGEKYQVYTVEGTQGAVATAL